MWIWDTSFQAWNTDNLSIMGIFRDLKRKCYELMSITDESL